MPTVILLDVSLSMCRPIRGSRNGDTAEVRQLANVGIGTLLDYFAQNAQLEYTSLLIFSSLWEIKQQFTRHHESIKNSIYDLKLFDKSNVVNAIRGALSLKLNEWAQNGPVNIILITDGLYYTNKQQETVVDDNDFQDMQLSELEGQFDFPCKMQVVCLSSPREPALRYSIPFYKSLIATVDSSSSNDCPIIIGSNSKNFKQSAIWMPESDTLDISLESVEELFTNISESHYKPYHTTLACGHLSSLVMLSPPPAECLLEPLKNEFDDSKQDESLETHVSAINKVRLFKLLDEISICGFMPLSEIASPSVTSRHLVFPIVNNRFSEVSKAEQILSQDPNAYKKSPQTFDSTSNKPAGAAGEISTSHSQDQDITKQPSFCVLLHNCLKQENMVAICMVGRNEESNEDWYGMLHTHTDSRKRSSLMLSMFIPGSSPVLWLPNFKLLGSVALNADLPPAIRDKIGRNRGPLKSYSSHNVIWLDPESVQADVQKIVRHAKRSPDKAPHFYKELNRIRRASISYGFYDVLLGLAAILEREKRVMHLDQSKGVNKETLDHIDHVIACLRTNLNEDSYDTNISPIA